MNNGTSETGNTRKRKPGQRSTGGKAPRKMLSIPQRREWERQHYQQREVPGTETQTFPSTSDQQVQCGNDTKSEKTQTRFGDYGNSLMKLQSDLESARKSNQYIEDEKTILWQRLHDAERLNKALINERTSLCLKDCCKDKA